MSNSEVDKALNEVLVILFNKIMTIESKTLIKDEFSDISVNDMHIIEAIGVDQAVRVTDAAKSMGITAGSINIAMNNLEKKDYIERNRSKADKRVVLVSLTEKGQRAFLHHKRFHDNMIKGIVDSLDEEGKEGLYTVLSRLVNYFDQL